MKTKTKYCMYSFGGFDKIVEGSIKPEGIIIVTSFQYKELRAKYLIELPTIEETSQYGNRIGILVGKTARHPIIVHGGSE